MLKKVLLIALGAALALGIAVFAAFQLSPWPSVLLIRYAFNKGAAETAPSQAALVPKGVTALVDLSYAPAERDAKLDVFAPPAAKAPLPAVVWVPGGGVAAGPPGGLPRLPQPPAGHWPPTLPVR